MGEPGVVRYKTQGDVQDNLKRDHCFLEGVNVSESFLLGRDVVESGLKVVVIFAGPELAYC